jgi:hypothetical protein
MGKEIQITIGPTAQRAAEMYEKKKKKKISKAAKTRNRTKVKKKQALDRKRKERGLI